MMGNSIIIITTATEKINASQERTTKTPKYID